MRLGKGLAQSVHRPPQRFDVPTPTMHLAESTGTHPTVPCSSPRLSRLPSPPLRERLMPQGNANRMPIFFGTDFGGKTRGGPPTCWGSQCRHARGVGYACCKDCNGLQENCKKVAARKGWAKRSARIYRNSNCTRSQFCPEPWRPAIRLERSSWYANNAGVPPVWMKTTCWSDVSIPLRA